MRKSLHKKEYAILLEQLSELRIRSGLRQIDLAKSLGTPQSFVSKMENGERRLDVVELREVVVALGCDFTTFVEDFETQLKKRK